MIDLLKLGSAPRTVPHDATVMEAALAMSKHHVGSLVVTRHGQPAGLVTDRDISLGALASGDAYDALLVESCATFPLQSVKAAASPAEAAAVMRQEGIRRLGLLGSAGELVGVVTLDDLIRHFGGLAGAVATTVNRELREEREPSVTWARFLGSE